MHAKTIGVLGGMGPDATALFFQKVVRLTPARSDQEHIPIVIYNNPQIPDRTEAILYEGESPVAALKGSLAILQKSAPDFICIPCNTVFFYYEEMQQSIDVPIIHLIESVVEYALAESTAISKIGLLATIGTIKSGLYHDCFQKQNIELIHPEEDKFDALQSAIHQLKNHSTDASQIQALASDLIAAGAQGVILGCTELSLVAEKLSLEVPILDSIEILAKKAVEVALGKKGL